MGSRIFLTLALCAIAASAAAKDFAFFEILKDGKASKAEIAQHCRTEDARVRIVSYASTAVTHSAARDRVRYKDAQGVASSNANPGEWSGEVYKALCPGLYSFSVDYTTGVAKGATAGDVSVKLMLWRKEAGGPRPGTIVGAAEKTGTAARGTGHINVMLRLGSGDEVSTFSASADGKPRYFERIALTGYLASPIDKLATDFDNAIWEAERTEADKVPPANAIP